MTIDFDKNELTSEQGFRCMVHFLNEHYKLTSGQITVGELISLCQNFEDDAPADLSMIEYWNNSVKIILGN